MKDDICIRPNLILDGEDIEMTRPVVSISTPVDYENEIFDIEMCFWTGTPWIGKPLPEPLKSGSVYKKKLPKMAFYAMDFNGWMWSNDDWDQRFEQLAVELIGSGKQCLPLFVNFSWYNII